MKIRLAEYVADYLASKGIKEVFTVVGGGAMYLNNAFGTNDKIRCTYTHHEQAAAIAAEGYAKSCGQMAVVCVTTGPGGTNALTGVLCAYQDNIPMLVISGQVRYATTVDSTGLNLRQMGEQEYHIVRSVKPMTKYAEMVKKPLEIKKMLDKAIYIANEGRKGPCWLDIPLDVQSAIIETDDLVEYIPEKKEREVEIPYEVIQMIQTAKRPVFLVGSGIRSSGMKARFMQVIEKYNIPVITATSMVDIFENSYPLYCGMFGVFGGRTGNFIVQNADLIISLGCRLTYKQIGFNYECFAPNAKKIVIDIDENELKKNLLKIDVPIHCDVKDFIDYLSKQEYKLDNEKWLSYCLALKKKYPTYLEKFKESKRVNPYYLKKCLNGYLKEDGVIVVGNSVACVSILQMGVESSRQQLFGNVNCGTMGYDLPAAVGAARAMDKEVICITGDGSIQMNIQELQTIKHNQLPVKIMIFNNRGYQAIVQSQSNFFQGQLSGCTKESGISMPDFEKLAYAYGFPYVRINYNEEVDEKLAEFFGNDGFAICEMIQDDSQNIEPRVKSKQLENGTLYSPPIDDLSPFLCDEEYAECQYKE